MSVTVRNLLAVARREFFVRFRSRTFIIGTLFLAIAGAALALAPIGVRWFEGESQTSVGVVNDATDPGLSFDPASRLGVLLNSSALGLGSAFKVETLTDEAAARAAVDDGSASAAVVIRRSAGGDLSFVIVTNDPAGRRNPELLRQVLLSLSVADRLDRLGVAPGDQATLFTAPDVTVERPTPTGADQPKTAAEEASNILVSQGLVIFLFIAIIVYGQWVAMSVAEEKSNRVMEIVLSAATPFQLLGGKVLGVGSLGLVQLGAAVVPAIAAFLLQGRISEIVLGAAPSELEIPQVLTPAVFLVFAAFFVLGYLLYSTLYAAAGSLVSRMEDINSIVAPMTLIAAAGYLVAIYSSIGFIPADAPWVVLLSFVPFVSPYLMLSRFISGESGPPEVLLGLAILAVSVVVMLWLAARVYAAGVLMYGQQAGFRKLLVTAFSRTR